VRRATNWDSARRRETSRKHDEEELLRLVDKYNNDKKYDGILVQLPLPKHISEEKILLRIDRARMSTVSTLSMWARWSSAVRTAISHAHRMASRSC